ncbi:MAG: hypothetical protein GY874_09885 [Desulfobacteraceae bacterium]|nr:hypothetical protein [Desulfobacteraceae bacterium]
MKENKSPFHAALNYSLKKWGWGAQSRLAKKINKKQQYISSIQKGLNDGAEKTRREIAAAFGYDYEDFLKLGRSLLGMPEKAPEPPAQPEPFIESHIAKLLTKLNKLTKADAKILESWLDGYLARKNK